jgi:hypothetical protein
MLSEIMKGQKNYEKDTVELIQEAIYGGHFWALGLGTARHHAQPC